VGSGLIAAWWFSAVLPAPTAEKPAAREPGRPQTRPDEKDTRVARITGAADHGWPDEVKMLTPGEVRPGRKFELRSGLLEITFDTGAKVILQGPCEFKVESANGGFLSLGKLTARVVPKTPRPKKPVSFEIRTPPAVIVGSKMEVGAEVAGSGNLRAHVIQGEAELRLTGDAKAGTRALTLGKDESARVEFGKDRSVKVVRETAPPPRVRPRRVPLKLFNTGVGLKEGAADPHWAVVAAGKDAALKPRNAVTPPVERDRFLPDDPAQSQWISAADAPGDLPMPASYTFRTTFDVAGALPGTAVIRGRFLANTHIEAIRLNGRSIDVPEHGSKPPFVDWHRFTAREGFVAGTNTLEIDVAIDRSGEDGRTEIAGPPALRVELEGTAVHEARKDAEEPAARQNQ
jgi:hypothetical protein